MTPTQYRAIRKSLGLTQAELSRVLGLELRAVQYHEAADGRIPPPVERLMWLMQMHPPLMHRLREVAE